MGIRKNIFAGLAICGRYRSKLTIIKTKSGFFYICPKQKSGCSGCHTSESRFLEELPGLLSEISLMNKKELKRILQHGSFREKLRFLKQTKAFLKTNRKQLVLEKK